MSKLGRRQQEQQQAQAEQAKQIEQMRADLEREKVERILRREKREPTGSFNLINVLRKINFLSLLQRQVDENFSFNHPFTPQRFLKIEKEVKLIV